jgi:hypothetical protein
MNDLDNVQQIPHEAPAQTPDAATLQTLEAAASKPKPSQIFTTIDSQGSVEVFTSASKFSVDSRRPTQIGLHKDQSISAVWAIRLVHNRPYRVLNGVALVVALFGTSLVQMCDLPDEPWNVIVDAMMVAVASVFIFDIVVQILADRQNYPFSFFFWMECVGSVSMLFEISFLLGTAGEMNEADTNVDATVMRAARTAKVGARAGRLVKLLKCLSFIYGNEIDVDACQKDDTKVIAARLSHYLSTKAAMMTIFFILVLPLFSLGSYPEDDLSMRSWAQRLENDYEMNAVLISSSVGGVPLDTYQRSVVEMISFYGKVDYYPWKLEGYPGELDMNGQQVVIPGARVNIEPEPNRKQNILKQEVTSCEILRPGCSIGWNIKDAPRKRF